MKSTDHQKANAGLKLVYQSSFPMVKDYILKNSGSESDALDIFQDAVVILYNQVRNGKFEERSSLTSYVYGIARNLWRQYLRRKKKIQMEVEIDDTQIINIGQQEEEGLQNSKILEQLLNKLDTNCQKLLKMFYYLGVSMKEITREFNLGSEQAAKTKKFRCMKKLQELFKVHNITKGSFI